VPDAHNKNFLPGLPETRSRLELRELGCCVAYYIRRDDLNDVKKDAENGA
jgi:hypothetical protein